MRAISLIISVIVLVALYESKVVEKRKIMVRNLKTEEKWNKSFEKSTLGKTKSKEEVKMIKEGHERLRARILSKLNAISGPLSATKTKGMAMNTVNNSKAEYSWIKGLKKLFLSGKDLTMNKVELEKLFKIINRYNRVGYLMVPETKAVRMKLMKKSMLEDISSDEEQFFAEIVLKMFYSYWKKVAKDFYSKIEDIESFRNEKSHNVSQKYRATYFIG
jgi:hypothetical protein